jgi:membrane protein DedA with SNARE-associated domain
VASAFLGSACGISISYALGYFVGPTVVKKLSSRFHVNPEHLTRAEQWIQRWGKYTLLITYFVPGVRHVAAVMSGAAKMRVGAFALFAYSGALVWSSTFIMFGFWLGVDWTRLSPALHRSLMLIGLVLGLVLVAGLVVLRRRTRADEPTQ